MHLLSREHREKEELKREGRSGVLPLLYIYIYIYIYVCVCVCVCVCVHVCVCMRSCVFIHTNTHCGYSQYCCQIEYIQSTDGYLAVHTSN
jgi:hypothetical protein